MSGRGRYPRALDLEELRWADWQRPATSSPEELRLSRQIARHLVSTKGFRYLTPADVPTSRVLRDDADLSLEHPINDLAGRGRVDIVLVDARRSVRTLLAIEVKVRASLAPARNPIPQIIRYREALTLAYGVGWRIDTLVVAEHFHDAVIEEADRKGLATADALIALGGFNRPL